MIAYPVSPMNCPVHGGRTVRRAIVHAKGCPGAKTDCADTCHPRHWHYCLECDWRSPYARARGVNPDSPKLAASARLGLRLRRVRKASGIDRGKLADLLGCQRPMLNLVETGCIVASAPLAQKIHRFLDVEHPPRVAPDSMVAFVKAVRQRRTLRGLSMLDCSQRAEVPLRGLCDLEFDCKPLDPVDLAKLCAYLKIEPPA